MKELSKATVRRALIGYTLTHEPSYEQSNGVYIIVEIDENFNVTEILAKRGRPVHTYSRLHRDGYGRSRPVPATSRK
ncbi:MAG: hypothetical protein ACREVK_00790 [Gammaproteobacteria bacterium]